MKPDRLVSVALLAAAFASTSWAQSPGDTSSRAAAAAPITHLAVGTVRSIDAAGRSATIDHQAIPSLNMPAMTMQFRLASSSSSPLKAGESIAFTFTASADGMTIGSVLPVTLRSDTGSARAEAGSAMPGMEHHGKQGKGDMKGMIDACPMMG